MSAPQLRPRPPLLGHARRVSSVALTGDGAQLLSGSLDRTPRLWNVDAGVCGRTLVGETSDVNAVTLGPEHVWDLDTGECIRGLEGHDGAVWGVGLPCRRPPRRGRHLRP
jgi:WD40 repeat protein